MNTGKGGKQSAQRRPIWLQQVKTFIKVADECDGLNDGIITLQKRKPVWLSLKLKDRSPRYLIGEIRAAGGDFCGEIGYTPSPNGNAISDGGAGYQGGVPFRNLGEALEYLAQYFDVRWCEGGAGPSKKGKPPSGTTAPSADAEGGKIPAPSASLSCVANQLLTLLSLATSSQAEFAKFYLAVKRCFAPAQFVVQGKDAHLERSWGNYPGVYVVRNLRAHDLYDGIIYVGMTGKITRRGAQMSGKLKFRPQRWDPYRFSSVGFSYAYSRKLRSYGKSINAADYVVDCFPFDSFGSAAPSFLEAAILQAYALTGPNRLPPANNAF